MITKHRTGYVRQRGKRFYVEYMIDGRRMTQMLRDDQERPVTSREEAEREKLRIMAPLMVAETEQALRNIQQKLDDSSVKREALERGAEDTVTLTNAWEAYVASVNRPDSGPRTLKGYEAQWREFVDWMREKHPACTELKQVSGRIGEAYAGYLLGEACDDQGAVVKRAFSTNTFNKHVRLLELVFRVLAKKADVASNPWADITRKTENKASRRELTVEELNTVCNRADGELQSLIVLGIYTGLRLGDCCTLRWSEVDMDRRIVLRVPNKTARRKNMPVHIPIHPTLLAFLEKTPKSRRTGFVLPEFAAKYRNNDSDVAKEIRRYFIECGIQVHRDGTGYVRAPSRGMREKNVHTGTRAVVEVGFHSLRHSFVSLCRQANAPLSVVEAIVGHSNPAMTRHYTHVGELAAAAAVGALPSLMEGAGASRALPDGESVGSGQAVVGSALAEQLKALAERLNGKNWKSVRAEMMALAGA